MASNPQQIVIQRDGTHRYFLFILTFGYFQKNWVNFSELPHDLGHGHALGVVAVGFSLALADFQNGDVSANHGC